jgi:HSP20 family protein
MFNLIPWKKRSNGGSLRVQSAEPSRQPIDYGPMARYQDEMDMLWSRFFDRWASLRGMENPSELWDLPRLDRNWDASWEDKDDKYVWHVELPGFEPEDFDVKISGNMLTIHAEHKEEQHHKKRGSSYRYGSFSRSFMLPGGVDVESIDAHYHSGVLELALPKTEQGRGKRILVNAK